MSKVAKLFKNPSLFYKDMIKKRTVKPAVKTEKKEQMGSMISAVWNKIIVNKVDLSHYEICLYFSGEVKDIYQLEQWVPILEALDNKKKLIIIVRTKTALTWLNANTNFTVIYCITLADVLKFYEENNIKVILYVNHAFKNFQSLINGKAFHVHINHGESDKTSTITRQSQAYDYIFVYGDESIRKYTTNLISCDKEKFIKIGRPQLEYTIVNELKIDDDKKTILYAPTWEGTHETMDFSSVRILGLLLINLLINSGKYHIVYKPHPKIGTRDTVVKSLHNEILNLLNEYDHHTIMLEGDIVSIYSSVDIAIFDNSVVLLDFLPYDKPLIVTDIVDEKVKELINTKSLVLESGTNLSKKNFFNIINIIEEELLMDVNKIQRNKVKKEFLGEFDYIKLESTNKFITEVEKLSLQRDILIEKLFK